MPRFNSTSIKTLSKLFLHNNLEIIFSALFTIILVFGYLLSSYKSIDVTHFGIFNILAYICSSIVIWCSIFFGITLIKRQSLRKSVVNTNIAFKKYSDRKLWLLTSLAIFICYLPIILACLSVLSPDAWSSIRQIVGDAPLSNTHPIIFTLFAGVFIKLGLLFNSLEFGITLFSIVQSAIMALIFAKIIVWMRQERIGRNYILATLFFYAILPINAIAGIIMWKDILFAGFGLLFLLILRQLYVQKDNFFTPKNIFYFIGVAFLFCAWRNNGIYAYILFTISAILIHHKIFLRTRYLLLLVVPVLLFFVYSVFSSLIAQPTSQAEIMSVPLQQIARTVKYAGNSISKDDQQTINEVLPYDKLAEKYNPNLSDPVKSSFNVKVFKKNKTRYIRLWLSLFIKHKKTYVAAFLYNTYGYVYPYFPSSTTTDIVLDNASHFNAIPGYSDPAYKDKGKSAVSTYRDIITGTIPFIHNIGFYTCLILVAAYVAIIKRRRELVGVFIILLSVFFTTILGPVNGEFRYLYLFVVAAPFILGSVYSNYRYVEGKK